MSTSQQDTQETLRMNWSAAGASVDFDADCSPTKVCRNMVGVTLDGFAEPGTDLPTAWKDRLRREGKLSTSGGSIRDLVLGSSEG